MKDKWRELMCEICVCVCVSQGVCFSVCVCVDTCWRQYLFSDMKTSENTLTRFTCPDRAVTQSPHGGPTGSKQRRVADDCH